MTFGEKLQAIRRQRGVKTIEIAKYIGKSDRQYRFYESDERDPSTKDLLGICNYLNVSADYLLDTPFKKSANLKQVDMDLDRRDRYNSLDTFGKKAVDTLIDIEHERIENKPQKKAKTVRLLYSNNLASAGTGYDLDEGVKQYKDFPLCDLSEEADLVVTVSGDSMQPMFNDGDEVYVKLQERIEIGQIGIFICGNEGYIKKLDSDRLISINPDYDDIYPDEDCDVKTIGLVLGKVER